MISKNHNHKLQSNPWHREEEPHNNHEIPGRHIKQINQLSLPHRDHCKTRMETYYCTTKYRTITESHNGSNNQQRIYNSRTTTRSQSHWGWGGGFKAFYWYQIFALNSAVVEAQNMLSSHGEFLTIAMHHHRETI